MIDLMKLALTGEVFWPIGATEDRTHNGVTYGRLRNLAVTWTPTRLTIEGSLGKFMKGENVSFMFWEMVIEAIAELEKDCGFSLDDAEIFLLEIGQTIIVDFPPWEYLKAWGKPQYYDHVTTNTETVLIKNKLRSFQGYDKTKEATKKRTKVPTEYQGMFLLRLEYKSKTANGLHLKDLKTIGVQRRLAQEFLDFYKSIPKHKTVMSSLPENYKDFKRFFNASAIKSLGGIEDFLEAVNSTKWERWQKEAAKKVAKEAVYEETQALPELESELNSKVEKAISDSFLERNSTAFQEWLFSQNPENSAENDEKTRRQQ